MGKSIASFHILLCLVVVGVITFKPTLALCQTNTPTYTPTSTPQWDYLKKVRALKIDITWTPSENQEAATVEYVKSHVCCNPTFTPVPTGNVLSGGVSVACTPTYQVYNAFYIEEGEGINLATVPDCGTSVSISGEDATVTNKGIASFSDSYFSVSSGAVSMDDIYLLNSGDTITGNLLSSDGSQQIGATGGNFFDYIAIDEIYLQATTKISGDTSNMMTFATNNLTKKTIMWICSVPSSTATQPFIAGSNVGILDWSFMSGLNHSGAQLGYWLYDDDRDYVSIGFDMPESWVDTGNANSIEFEFECQRTGGADAVLVFTLFLSNNTTPIINDSFTCGSSKAFVNLDTLSSGIGADSDIVGGVGYVMLISGDATDDNARLYQVKMIITTGIMNDAS